MKGAKKMSRKICGVQIGNPPFRPGETSSSTRGLTPAYFRMPPPGGAGWPRLSKPWGMENREFSLSWKKSTSDLKTPTWRISPPFDHAGENQFFPEAIFLVSEAELEFAIKRENEARWHFRKDWDHLLTYQEIEGPSDICGAGSLVAIPLLDHTPGHQGLLVRLRKDEGMILREDIVPCEENHL
jgi:hypothetical protein